MALGKSPAHRLAFRLHSALRRDLNAIQLSTMQSNVPEDVEEGDSWVLIDAEPSLTTLKSLPPQSYEFGIEEMHFTERGPESVWVASVIVLPGPEVLVQKEAGSPPLDLIKQMIFGV